jgi:hypothetical protein
MPSDLDLANEALAIQMRRGWSIIRCCELAHVAPSTWRDCVSHAAYRTLSKRLRWKIAAFVRTYQDDAVPEPPRQRKWKRGPEHHLSKLTPEQEAMIVSSTRKGVELARELSVSPSLITRVRQRAKYDVL